MREKHSVERRRNQKSEDGEHSGRKTLQKGASPNWGVTILRKNRNVVHASKALPKK